MRVIAVKTLRDFSAKHPSAKQSLLAWHDKACKSNWQTPADIKRHFASASFLSDNRVVFNIKGNDFRLITSIAYRLGVVYIKFVGTHAQYDAVDATTVDIN